jgi:STE24 endopeptidase
MTTACISAAEGGRGHFGAWRALAAAPAMLGSGLLLLVVLGGAGAWRSTALLGWLGSGGVVFSRVGERMAVRLVCGFRRPSRAERIRLEPVWAAALARCGTPAGEIDWYVQLADVPNAYAAGGRSVAVTTRVVADFLAGRITAHAVEAIFVHDLLTAPTPGLEVNARAGGLVGCA